MFTTVHLSTPQQPLLHDRSKNTNLVQDVIFSVWSSIVKFPVKFRLIPYSCCGEEVKQKYFNQLQSEAIYVDGSTQNKGWTLASYQV